MDCVICFDSPCSCDTGAKPVKTARAIRRSSAPTTSQNRRVVRFSTDTSVAVSVESESQKRNTQHQESMSVEISEEEAVRILAPLLSEGDLECYRDYLPMDCRLTLDERRRKFRDEVKWSQGRYDD